MTLEALADVDAGRAIDHEIIQAWAASPSRTRPQWEQMTKRG
jgi:hypothetical protein